MSDLRAFTKWDQSAWLDDISADPFTSCLTGYDGPENSVLEVCVTVTGQLGLNRFCNVPEGGLTSE
eukprot:3130050-Rhodomonas_salina.2